MTQRSARRLLATTGACALATVVAAGLVSLVQPQATAAPTPTGLLSAPADVRIDNSYIVVLKPDTQGLLPGQTVAEKAADLADKHDAVVKHTYTSALRGFSATLTKAEAEELAKDDSVAFVQENKRVSIEATQSNATWGIDRIDQRDRPLSTTYTYSTTASNVSAYIIDTGIRTTHSQFTGRTGTGYSAISDGNGTNDCNGHGTHVAGTVGGTTYGVAKGVRLYPVRVLDCEGSGDDAGVIAGIDWVTANAVKPAVANMSLGGEASTALDNAVRRSIAAGITYALAAGNESEDACIGSPSRTLEAITVGATTNTDARASYSNFGTCVDIFAPGSSITSAWSTSNTATDTISGTSMASPHVAGAAALYLADNPSATPAQVAAALIANASTGKVTSPGTGSPNRLLYTGGTTPGPTPSPTPSPTPGGKYFQNLTQYPIADLGEANSPITVTGVSGNAPATLKVTVDIRHTYKGDLIVDLIAPDGSAYNIHNRTGGSTDNVIGTFTVSNATSEVANGSWKLRVRDRASGDTGTITKFGLQF